MALNFRERNTLKWPTLIAICSSARHHFIDAARVKGKHGVIVSTARGFFIAPAFP